MAVIMLRRYGQTDRANYQKASRPQGDNLNLHKQMTQFRYEHRGRREGRCVTRYGLPSGRDTGEFRKRSEASSQSPGRSSPKVSKEVDSSDETGGMGIVKFPGGLAREKELEGFEKAQRLGDAGARRWSGASAAALLCFGALAPS